MDPYLFSLGLGGLGLGAMAVSGLSHGHGHGGRGGRGHGHARGHAGHGHAHTLREQATQGIWALTSPRILFSFLVGMGATGLVARPLIGAGVVLAAVAVAGGIAFERLLVRPLWNLAFRFESAPALTLESALFDEVRAATGFDANGQGLVALEMDGQVRQVLGTLRAEDRGRRVRAGDRLRVEDVDAERNRCTVALIE